MNLTLPTIQPHLYSSSGKCPICYSQEETWAHVMYGDYGDAITSSSVLDLLLNVLPCIRQIIELCLIENSCKSFRSCPYGLYHLFMILMMPPSQSLTSFEVL